MPAGKISNNGRGGIGRVIVDHHHMKAVVRIILREQRTQARSDIGFLIAGRNDHADVGSVIVRKHRGAAEAGEKPALPGGPRDQPRHDRKP